MNFLFFLIIPVLGLAMLAGCGKKGPPLPPLPDKDAGIYRPEPSTIEMAKETGVKEAPIGAVEKKTLEDRLKDI